MATSSLAFCAAFLTLLALCSANLMSVDLGLSYIKVAIARPGKGLELVTNEQSKRKTPAAVGFTDEGERLFGDAAVAYAAKAPTRTILDGRSFVGKCVSAEHSPDHQHNALCQRDLLHLQGVGKFSGEEIISMQLAMARKQASAALDAPVKDVAVTVPAWFDERQRQAVADAARIIGLNCLGVVNANTAAAIKYALDGKAKPTEERIAAEQSKDKKKKPPKSLTQTVMFYDIGAGSASASVARITTDVKTGVASGVKMLSHAWEKGVGGRLLDTVVVDRLADAFDKQRGPSATPSRELPRVMMRLRKEAQRVREVLSANTDTIVSVASLYDDLDLRTTISRAEFESDAESMFNLIGNPAKEALADANLSSNDLDAVVPFGGVSRTPIVQQKLCDSLGISSLNKSINSDEAAVMGSVFYAASLSSTFRVRKLDFEDIYTRSISAEIEREASSGGMFSSTEKKPPQKVDIFPEGIAKMPSKKTLSLNREKDFSLRVYLGMDKTGKSRFPEHTLYSHINVKGVAKVLKKLKDPSKAKNITPRVALTFRVDRSGLISIGTAESSIDETIVVEREVEVKEDKSSSSEKPTEDEKDSGKKSDDEKSGNVEEEKEVTEESKADEESKGKEKKKDKKKKKKTKIEKSTQTIVHRQTLTIEYSSEEGVMGMQMTGKELEAAKKVLKELENADLERVERADALNALEGFILEVRSKVRGVDEDDDLYKVSTEEEREALVVAFDEAEDWMYTDEASKTANLRQKHFDLQKIYEPMETRTAEIEARPKALKLLSTSISLSVEKLAELRDTHESRGSTHLKAFDKADAFCETLKKWVADMEEAQSGKSLTEEPAVKSADALKKIEELRTELGKVIRLPVPPAPKKESDDVEEESVNSTSTELPKTGEQDLDVPAAPDADSATADAASASSVKDEL